MKFFYLCNIHSENPTLFLEPYYFADGELFVAHLLTKYPPLFLGPEKTISPCSLNFFIQRSTVFEGIFDAAAISTTLLPGFLPMNSKSRFIPSFIPSLAGRRINFTTKAPVVSFNSGLGLPFMAHPSSIR